MSSSPSTFQSFSVPSSPVAMRSTKEHPVTPQRQPRHTQHRQSQSFYVNTARSPLTPSSPYTPLSLRSADTSSTLTTPDSFAMGGCGKRRFAFSPEVVVRGGAASATGKDNTLADIAENWRSRASENGIKVSSARPMHDESRYDDDVSEQTMSDANDSGLLSADDILLPAAFLSTHRRTNSDAIAARTRVHPQAPRPQPISPTILRNVRGPPASTTPVRPRRTLASLNQTMNIMSTPPPNRALTDQLKLKGSFTDPAQPRRREAFGVIRTPSQNVNISNCSMNPNFGFAQHETSLDLFDIDENDFEYQEYGIDYPRAHLQADASFDMMPARNTIANNNSSNNSNNYGYPTPYALPQQSPSFPVPAPAFADPFLGMGQGNALGRITDSLEQHFHQQQHREEQLHFAYGPRLAMPQAQSFPAAAYVHVPVPAFPSPVPAFPMPQTLPAPASPLPAAGKSQGAPASPPQSSTDCSVCLAASPATLAILKPCGHPLCSGCLTSALNIVGEKDMECAVCRRGVEDFKLVLGGKKASFLQDTNDDKEKKDKEEESEKGDSFMEPESPGNESVRELESPFEFGLDFQVEEMRASTPKLEQQASRAESPVAPQYVHNSTKAQGGKRGARKSEENVVLRIDNVPWDITPQQITRWLQQPIARVHVLLDPKGKTLSHAYVEVADVGVAGAILRGECEGKRERGSVLGRGRRARGVTVTRSGQQELMADLFRNWRGTFDGSRPSLMGLEGDRIVGALEGGLLNENELAGLLYLIKEPDSHFLKVPVLPFHSLISILSKFPADVDSRVFWSTSVRDKLFDVAYIAVQVLLTRVEQAKNNSQEDEYTIDLVHDLAWTAMDCQAFTAQQVRKLANLLEASGVALPPLREDDSASSGSGSRMSMPRTPNGPAAPYSVSVGVASGEPFRDLAREFGVEAQLVQALAQRLAGAGLC